METTESIRRKLLTFALINQNFSGRVDPVTALFPLFAPIATDRAGQIFAASTFQSDMKERYGMSLSRDVVDLFTQRLRQLGLLDGGKDRAVWNASQIAAHNEKDDAELSKIDKLIVRAAEFSAQRKELIAYEVDENRLLQAILEVVLGAQSVVNNAVDAVSVSEGVPVARGAAQRAKTADQYFASNLISWIRDNDGELFTWIAGLSGAAIVAEALVEIRSPSLPANVHADLTVYLDTPFLMELLGCSGSGARSDAKYIVQSLKHHGVQIAVLAHSMDELRYNLKGVLLAPPTSRTGPSATALLFGEVSEVFLQNVLDDPEYHITNAGIAIVDINSNRALVNMASFSEDDEQNFFAAIQSYYNHMEAALRDAASVAWVMRRRKGDQARDVLKAKHILLTRNILIYRVINRFCMDRGYVRPDTAGPVVLARDLAGVLWLISGSEERIEISKKQLIMNCQRAKNNAPDTINSMVRTLESVNKESAELFWLAVQKPSYLSLALDTVAGSGSGVTATIVDETLDKIRDDLVSEERAKGRETIRKTKELYERDSALKEVVIESLKSERELLALEKERLADSWRKFSQKQWRKYAVATRRRLVLAEALMPLVVGVLSILGLYIASDLVHWNPSLEFGLGSIIVVSVMLITGRSFAGWIKRRIEDSGQKEYAAILSANVPDLVLEAVKRTEKMTAATFLGNVRGLFDRSMPATSENGD